MSNRLSAPPDTLPVRRYILWGGLLALLVLTGTALFVVFRAIFNAPAVPLNNLQPLPADEGVTAIQPRTVNDFTLTAHTGAPFTLSDVRGQPVLLFFGYTHCPDVCPLTLTVFQRVQAALGPEAADVKFLFISVDGERDTPQHIADYLAARGVEDFVIGLNATDGDLRRLGVDYGLFFQRQPEESGNYLMDHTGSVFLLNSRGELTTVFRFGTQPDVIATAVQDSLST